MTDDELDRLLAEAGAVEPTRPFVARVRARLAEEPTPSARGVWPWIGAAVALATALVVALVPNQNATPDPAVTTAGPHVAAGPRHEPRERAATERVTQVRAARGEIRRPAPRAPRAVFAPSDRAAFALLLAASEAGAMPALDVAPDVVRLDDRQVGDRVIAPLEVPSLTLSDDGATNPTEGDPR